MSIEDNKITNLQDLLDEVMYSWDYEFATGNRITKHAELMDKDNPTAHPWSYSINKLYVLPNEIHYKTELTKLDPKIFYQFETIYQMMYEDAPSIKEIIDVLSDKAVLAEWLTSPNLQRRQLAELIVKQK